MKYILLVFLFSFSFIARSQVVSNLDRSHYRPQKEYYFYIGYDTIKKCRVYEAQRYCTYRYVRKYLSNKRKESSVDGVYWVKNTSVDDGQLLHYLNDYKFKN